MNKSIFYDYHDLISRGALLNIVIGERGVGKTYSAIKMAVNDYFKHGNEFVYLRRYKSELKESVPNFFDAINHNEEFPEANLRSHNNKFYNGKDVIGYAIPLSTANILKGTTFDKVKTIIFDEFLIDKGCYRFLQNEVTQFLDIIETISRLRDVRVFMLGNAVSIHNNPYFDYFDIDLPYNSNFKMFKNGLICVNYIKNEAYREEKRKSRFGQLIEGTDYGKYAIDNQILHDNKDFIGKRGINSKLYCTINLFGNILGIWKDSNGMYVSKDYDPSSTFIFACTADDHNESTILEEASQSIWFMVCKACYNSGKLLFENQKIKNDFLNLLNKRR